MCVDGSCVENPVHSVLYLILTFFAIAGHYVLLNAQFLAAVHVIVYAGAIMVLFLYVIMMLNLNAETEPQKGKWLRVAATMAGGLLMVVLVGALRSAADTISLPVQDSQIGMIKTLAVYCTKTSCCHLKYLPSSFFPQWLELLC